MEIKTLRAKEREHLTSVLVMTSWDMREAARLLQISISELKKKMRSHLIELPQEGISSGDGDKKGGDHSS